MRWNRSTAIAPALENCSTCQGAGLRITYGTSVRPCACVYRSIGRAVVRRYRECGEFPRIGLDRRGEEFRADVVAIARRALPPEDYPFFVRFVLTGAGRDREDKGKFFHDFYRVEEIIGRAYAETEPYALWPLDEYFTGTTRTRWAKERPGGGTPVWAPRRKTAPKTKLPGNPKGSRDERMAWMRAKQTVKRTTGEGGSAYEVLDVLAA